MALTWAAGQMCLPSSWGPPGDSQSSIPPLHSEKVPPDTMSKPEGTAPSITLPEPNLGKQRSKGEQSCFTAGMDPLKHFMASSMVSISHWWWVRTARPCQWGSGVQMGRALLLPGVCSPCLAADIYPLWPCCRRLPPLTASETQNNPFGCGGFEILSHDEFVTLPYLSLSLSVSPQWLSWLETVQATVFIFRAEQNVSGWQPRLAGANRNLVELNMVSSLAPWPFLERAVLSWYHFLASHCTGESKSQG